MQCLGQYKIIINISNIRMRGRCYDIFVVMLENSKRKIEKEFIIK